MISYLIFTLTTGAVYGLLALSVNLVWGGAGLINLGIAGFFAVGAYTSALLSLSGVPIALSILAAVVVGALVGVAATWATVRLRGDYLAIVTLGFAEVVRLVAMNEYWLTNGTDGLPGIPAPLKAELGTGGFAQFYLILIFVILSFVFFLLRRLDLAPFGRVLKSIREDQGLAAFAGKNIMRFKVVAFATSSAVAGLAGALYAHYQSYISPDHFQPLLTIYIFLAVTVGGVGRPAGALLGAFIVIFFLEGTRFAGHLIPGLGAGQVAALREIMVGLVFILVLHLRPQGILPERIPPAPKQPDPAKP